MSNPGHSDVVGPSGAGTSEGHQGDKHLGLPGAPWGGVWGASGGPDPRVLAWGGERALQGGMASASTRRQQVLPPEREAIPPGPMSRKLFQILGRKAIMELPPG